MARKSVSLYHTGGVAARKVIKLVACKVFTRFGIQSIVLVACVKRY